MKHYVISDIHGCINTFNALLEKIMLHKADQLFLLGDYIDKGKDGAEVIDKIISLQNSGYKVYPIKGNHEDYLLQIVEEYDIESASRVITTLNKSKGLLDENNKVHKHYLQFIDKLPYYYELDDFWLVHAGFNTKREDFLQDHDSMLEIRGFSYNPKLLKGKSVIHGHDVKPLEIIKQAISKKEKIIPLDNGCYVTKKHKRYDYTKTGHLCCLNIDSMELVTQRNIE